MYKFFINDKPLIISGQGSDFGRFQELEQATWQGAEKIMDIVRKAEEVNSKGMILLAEDPVSALIELKSHFKAIDAGGGLVFNRDGKLLLMKRLGKWDLPKGKIDPGETIEEGAIREVEEECGINRLKIREFFGNSYHTYKLQGHRFLKITHWYIMETMFEGDLTPQAEENITEVIWADFDLLDPETLDTYESIRDLLRELKIRMAKS